MARSDKGPGLLSPLLVLAMATAISMPLVLITAHIMVVIWGWWAVPYGLPALPFWVAAAIDILYSLVRGPIPDLLSTAEHDVIYEQARTGTEYFWGAFWWSAKRAGAVLVHVLSIWGIAYLLHVLVQ